VRRRHGGRDLLVLPPPVPLPSYPIYRGARGEVEAPIADSVEAGGAPVTTADTAAEAAALVLAEVLEAVGARTLLARTSSAPSPKVSIE
jgi:hypothetical protein